MAETTKVLSSSNSKQEGTAPARTPKKPTHYWRNISNQDQAITAPDGAHRTIPPGTLVHEDQFLDPDILPKQPTLFVKLTNEDTAKQEKLNRALVVGGPHNTAKGQYTTSGLT